MNFCDQERHRVTTFKAFKSYGPESKDHVFPFDTFELSYLQISKISLIPSAEHWNLTYRMSLNNHGFVCYWMSVRSHCTHYDHGYIAYMFKVTTKSPAFLKTLSTGSASLLCTCETVLNYIQPMGRGHWIEAMSWECCCRQEVTIKGRKQRTGGIFLLV